MLVYGNHIYYPIGFVYILSVWLMPVLLLWHQSVWGGGIVWTRLFPFILFQPDCRVENEMSRLGVGVNIEVSNTVELKI